MEFVKTHSSTYDPNFLPFEALVCSKGTTTTARSVAWIMPMKDETLTYRIIAVIKSIFAMTTGALSVASRTARRGG
jgi:hypothetical protein